VNTVEIPRFFKYKVYVIEVSTLETHDFQSVCRSFGIGYYEISDFRKSTYVIITIVIIIDGVPVVPKYLVLNVLLSVAFVLSSVRTAVIFLTVLDISDYV
jgi:hypothetical protein